MTRSAIEFRWLWLALALCGVAAVAAAAADSPTEIVEQLRTACQRPADIDAVARAKDELCRLAREGDADALAAMTAALADLRIRPDEWWSQADFDQHVSTKFFLISLLEAFSHSEDFFEYASKALADPECSPRILEPMVEIITLSSRDLLCHLHSREAVRKFAIQAAKHESPKVHQPAMIALTGVYAYGNRYDEGLDPAAAIPILENYAHGPGGLLFERAWYMIPLIALDAPNADDYVHLFRDTVDDESQPVFVRRFCADVLVNCELLDDAVLKKLEAEEKNEHRTLGTKTTITNGVCTVTEVSADDD